MRGKFDLLIKLFKLPKYYRIVPKMYLFVNFIYQRIFRLNSDVPFSVHFTNKIQGYSGMQLGDSVKFSLAVSGGCYITAFPGTKLIIGEGTILAPNVAIQTGNHGLLDRGLYDIADINIGKNCWLGFGVVILAGVSLGNNVTVGANSVVTKSFSGNVVIAGVPAKIIKEITCVELQDN